MIKKILSVFVTFMLVFVFTSSVSAFQLITAKDDEPNVTLEKDKAANDNYAVFANNITMDSNVGGDLIAAGNQIEVNGEVDGNVFAGANSVTINSIVKRDVFAGSNDLKISKNAVIGGDLYVGSATVVINGEVKGKVYAGTGSLTVNGKVGNGIRAEVGTLKLTETSEVTGDIVYTSDKKATVLEGAKYSGKLEQKVFSKINLREKAIDSLISLLAVFLVAYLFVLFFAKKTETLNTFLKTSFWKSLGFGFLTLIVIPIIIFILFITIIGMPLATILLGLYLLALYLTKVITGVYLGRMIMGEQFSLIWSAVIGLLVLAILAFIPVVGGIVGFLTVLLGLGAITGMVFEKK